MTWPLLSLLPAWLAAAPGAVAVLPVQVRVQGPTALETSSLLTNVLTSRLAQQPELRVISADEVAALLQHEAERQGTGCTDDGCLAEIAGALGADRVVTGEVVELGRELLWTSRLLDQRQGLVVGSGSARGGSVPDLVAQVEEVALALTGHADQARLAGKAAQERLGLTSEEDLGKFREFREAHSTLSTREALTQFILEHNGESPVLAGAEAAAFGLAGLFLMPACGLASLPAFSSLGAERNPVLGVALGAGVLAMASAMVLGSMAATATGLGLTGVDALDLGRVEVKRNGCCRDEARLLDQQRRTTVLRMMALFTLLAGPVAVAGSAGGTMMLLALTTLTARASIAEPRTVALVGGSVVVSGLALLAVLGLVATAGPAGAWFFLKPQGPLVEEP